MITGSQNFLEGLPSVDTLKRPRDVAETLSDIRSWMRRASTQSGGLESAGHTLKTEHLHAVITFLESLSSDRIRQRVAQELLGKLATSGDVWKVTESMPPEKVTPVILTQGSTFLQGHPGLEKHHPSFTRCSSVPARAARRDSKSSSSSRRLPLDGQLEATANRIFIGEAWITENFCIPLPRHHLIIGKGGKGISALRDQHGVEIKVPRAEECADVVSITGTPAAVAACRLSVEEIVGMPVDKEPLQCVTLAVPQGRYGLIIGENASTLQTIMSECKVHIEVPKKDVKGDVKVQGRLSSCLQAKAKMETLIKDTIPILSSKEGDAPVMPLPPSYDLSTSRPIRRCLFFPDHPESGLDSGLSTLGVFLKFLDSTRISCDICVFTITDDRISRRMLDAHRYRNVKVRVITDKEQCSSLGSDIVELQRSGVEVRLNDSPYHMHHKFCVLDKKVLMNGSFNWTQGASENNNENIMITNDAAYVSEFRAQFETLWREYRSQPCIKLPPKHNHTYK